MMIHTVNVVVGFQVIIAVRKYEEYMKVKEQYDASVGKPTGLFKKFK